MKELLHYVNLQNLADVINSLYTFFSPLHSFLTDSMCDRIKCNPICTQVTNETTE